MNIVEYLKHCFKYKTWYLGYTWGEDIEVIELDLPFFGPKRRDKTLLHEMGHLQINKDSDSLTYWEKMQLHKHYDRLTWHGILQKRYKKILTIYKWSYTKEDLKLFGKRR